ncbi:MAG: hypothetical protein QM723_20645 [Myxococcaceae bacterium]
MRRSLNLFAAVICCGALSCTVNTNTGSKYAKTQEINASNGGTLTVSQSDDASLAGLKIQVPPNALSKNTTLTVAEGNGFTLADGAAAVGPIADLGPVDATFVHPITITLPFALAGNQDPKFLAVQGIDASGTHITVSGKDLLIDPINHVVAFTAVHLHRFAAVIINSGGTVCPQGEVFCGCCDNGTCQPAGSACPLIACPAFCEKDGGSGGGGGGGSCCPAGESWCGCGNSGKCLPDGEACPLACPQSNDPTAGNGGTANGPAPTCCGPGTYLCGCGGVGECIADDKACPLKCPICDPTLIDSPCGCIPPGAVCECDPNKPSTVACQCDPSATNAGGVCEVDAGNPCPSATDVLTPCGCLPPGAICAPPPSDGGLNCANAQIGSKECCDGTCVGPNQACPNICFKDGGTSTVDGGVCPIGTVACPASSANGPKCVPQGKSCS